MAKKVVVLENHSLKQRVGYGNINDDPIVKAFPATAIKPACVVCAESLGGYRTVINNESWVAGFYPSNALQATLSMQNSLRNSLHFKALTKSALIAQSSEVIDFLVFSLPHFRIHSDVESALKNFFEGENQIAKRRKVIVKDVCVEPVARGLFNDFKSGNLRSNPANAQELAQKRILAISCGYGTLDYGFFEDGKYLASASGTIFSGLKQVLDRAEYDVVREFGPLGSEAMEEALIKKSKTIQVQNELIHFQNFIDMSEGSEQAQGVGKIYDAARGFDPELILVGGDGCQFYDDFIAQRFRNVEVLNMTEGEGVRGHWLRYASIARSYH